MVALLPDCTLLRFSVRSFLAIETQQNDAKWRIKTQQNDAKWRIKIQQNNSKWRKEFSKCQHKRDEDNQNEMDRKSGNKMQQNNAKWRNKMQQNDAKWRNEMDRKQKKKKISSEDGTMCNSPLYSCVYFSLFHHCNCLLHLLG